MDIAAKQVNLFLNKIKQLHSEIQTSYSHTAEEALIKFENLLTLDKLQTCFTNTIPDKLTNELIALLAERWERIRGEQLRKGMLAYTEQPSNRVNQLCIELATTLSPLPAKEDQIDELPAGVGPYFLLMPTLRAHQDIYGQNIHNLRIHEFILSDDDERFIPLEACFNHALHSDLGQFEHLVSLNTQYSLLTTNEFERLSTHSELTQAFAKAIVAYNKERLQGNSIGPRLSKLANALRAGGEHHGKGATNFNAGAAANEGICEFSLYWNELPKNQQEQLYRSYPDLKDALGRLMRPKDQDYREVRFCVESIADKLETIIRGCNQNVTLISSLQEAAIIQQSRFSFAQKKEIYPTSWHNLKPPNVLRELFSLNLRQQQNIFRGTPYDSAFMYMLICEENNLPNFINLLDETSKRHAMNTTNAQGATPLILAAKRGDETLVKNFLTLGADINARDKMDWTALHWAARNGCNNVVGILLDNGANIDTIGHQGNTSLHMAIMERKLTVIDQLLARGAAIHIRNDANNNPLNWALSFCPHAIKPILLRAITFSPEKQKELLKTVSGGTFDNVLMFAIHWRVDIFSGLLFEDNIHERSIPASIINAKNARGESPIILAAKQNHDEAIRLLLNLGASMETIDADGDTPLNILITRKNRSSVLALLERGAVINTRNIRGDNALDLALREKVSFIDDILLKAILLSVAEQKELLLNVEEGIYSHVLTYAIHKKSELCLPLLAKLLNSNQVIPESILNLKNTEGKTLLMLAAQGREYGMVQRLLAMGADIAATDNQGNTVLHELVMLAAHSRVFGEAYASVLQTLLNYNGPLTKRNHNGKNVFDFCEIYNANIVRHLILAQAILLTLPEQKEFLYNSAYHSVLEYAESNAASMEKILLAALTLTSEQQKDLLSTIYGDVYENILIFASINHPEVLGSLFLACGKSRQYLVFAQKDLEKVFNFFNCVAPIQNELYSLQSKNGLNDYSRRKLVVLTNLMEQLELARMTFLLSDKTAEERKVVFKQRCLAAISDARPGLEKHRGYIARLFVARPKSMQLLDELHSALTMISEAPKDEASLSLALN